MKGADQRPDEAKHPEWRVKRFLPVHTLLRRYVRGEATDREREEKVGAQKKVTFNHEQLKNYPFCSYSSKRRTDFTEK